MKGGWQKSTRGHLRDPRAASSRLLCSLVCTCDIVELHNKVAIAVRNCYEHDDFFLKVFELADETMTLLSSWDEDDPKVV